MTTNNHLYELAFRYKKTLLWEKMCEQQVFAIPLQDGRTGYISVMGNDGQFIGLNLYLDEGFNTYRRLVNFDPFFCESEFEEHELLLGQDCLQLSWGTKDDMTPEELKEIRKYAKANGISLRGKDSYPLFRRFSPAFLPWPFTEIKEQEYMEAALSAAITVAEENMMGQIKELNLKNKTVPGLILKNDVWSYGKRVKLPQEQENLFPQADKDRLNAIGLKKVQKLKKKDTLECALLMLPTPIQEDKTQPPYCPYILMAVRSGNGVLLDYHPVSHTKLIETPEEILNRLIDALLKEKVRPAAFECEDERTYQILEPLAEALDIQVVKSDYLDALEECEDRLIEFIDGWDSDPDSEEDDEEDDFPEDDDDFAEEDEELVQAFIDELLTLPDAEARKMPKEIKDALKELIESGVLPAGTERSLRRKFGMK